MHTFFRRSIPVFFFLISAALLLYSFIDNETTAISPQDYIASTLSALGAADAEFVEQISDPGRSRDGCLLYTSDSTQMGYYFEPDTGVLKSISHYSHINSTYSEKASDASALTPMQVTENDRSDALLQYAKACIGEDLIGELRIETKQDQGTMHRYTVTELYDGIETGTTVMFSCTSEGQIIRVNVAIGSVFEKNADGSYSIVDGGELIGEEAAVEAARAGLEALLDPPYISELASCRLDAAEDKLVYTVEIPFTDENDLSRIYSAAVIAQTGELWREAVSK